MIKFALIWSAAPLCAGGPKKRLADCQYLHIAVSVTIFLFVVGILLSKLLSCVKYK